MGLFRRIVSLAKRGRLEQEIDEELQEHIAMCVDDNMAQGMSRADAERDANVRFGNPIAMRERVSAEDAALGIESLWRDVRGAIHVFIKSAGFTAAVVVSLALGIGANTAIFTLLDAVMWPILQVRDPGALFAAGRTDGGTVVPGFSYKEYRSLQNESRAAEVAGYWNTALQVSIEGNPGPSVQGLLVTGNYFALLGVQPTLGREIDPADDQGTNEHPVVVLSYECWQRRFEGDASVVGRSIRISAVPFTIIGVAPPGFTGMETGTAPELFLPITMQPAAVPQYENLLEEPMVGRWWVQAIVRARPGVSAQQAAATLDAAFRNQRDRDERSEATRIVLAPAAAMSGLRRRFSRPLLVLMAMVGVVLLTACANVANLLLARAAARRPEFALRLALGATRARLMRQLLVESVLLASLGGACGVGLAHWGTRILVTLLSTGGTSVQLDLAPNLRVLMFTAVLSILTGVVFGFAPAWRAARIEPAPALKHLRSAATQGLRPGRILSIAQLALSMVLLVAAGLFMRSLARMYGADAEGLRQSVVVMRVEPKGSDQRGIAGTSERLDRLYRDLIRRVSDIPGVRAVSLANTTPTSPKSTLALLVTTNSGERLRVTDLMVYPNYFATLGIPILRGRDFAEDDLSSSASAVCIVNEAYARRVYPGEDPLGKSCEKTSRPKLLWNAVGPRPEEEYRIIGVEQDSRYGNPRGEVEPLIFTPFLLTSTGRGQMALFVRLEGDARGIVPRIWQEVAAADKTMPMQEVYTLAEEMNAALVPQRLVALLAGFFGGLVLLLACVGLYGLMSFTSTERLSEMAIRIALGARRGSVVWLVVRDALAQVTAGIATGLPAALIAVRLASSTVAGLLFGSRATDPVTIGGAAVVLALVATFAAYLPARRASRVDPNALLRTE